MNESLHRELLRKRIERWEPDYDSEVKLLRLPFTSPGYHTTLQNKDYVHPTYPNLVYAVAMLDSGIPAYEQRACDIIRTVITLQETDTEKDTFGIWPWFWEEPLSQMSPPDWNWADFCGKLLLQAVLRHGNRLPDPLKEEIQAAVYRATDAIIKRNVDPSYTNIAIMGAFVTIIAGEHYHRTDYYAYGIRRLERFRDFTNRLHTFQEYNSPTYALITILELSKLRKESVSNQVKAICEEMLELCWRMIAEHYHPVLKQWCGPHSRSYSTLLKPEAASFLQIATDGAVDLLPMDQLVYSPEWFGSGIRCPDTYAPYFLETQSRTIRELFYRDEKKKFEKTAHAYMTPKYALGTFTREIMWNQCRSFIAYLDNGGGAAYIHLRVLNNGYDYCSALLTSQQQEGDVIGAIQFFTNGGDTHPNLDKKGGRIETEDFRIRFEVGGKLDGTQCKLIQPDEATIVMGELQASLRLLYGEFQDSAEEAPTPLQWTIHQQSGLWCIDLVIYSGVARMLDFQHIHKLACIFAVSLKESSEITMETMVIKDEEKGCISAVGRSVDRELMVTIPWKPGEV